MKDEITVDVTKDDIRNAKQFSCELCPIAVAVKRITGSAVVQVTGVMSDDAMASCFEDEDAVFGTEYLLSPTAQKFANDFDAGKRVKPFRFVMTKAKGAQA